MIHLQKKKSLSDLILLVSPFQRAGDMAGEFQWSVRDRDGRESSLVEYLKNNPSLLCVFKGGTCILTLHYICYYLCAAKDVYNDFVYLSKQSLIALDNSSSFPTWLCDALRLIYAHRFGFYVPDKSHAINTTILFRLVFSCNMSHFCWACLKVYFHRYTTLTLKLFAKLQKSERQQLNVCSFYF